MNNIVCDKVRKMIIKKDSIRIQSDNFVIKMERKDNKRLYYIVPKATDYIILRCFSNTYENWFDLREVYQDISVKCRINLY